MPGKTYFKDPYSADRMKGVLNHVPYVDLDLYHNSWFYISNSSGIRAIKKAERQRGAVAEMTRRPILAALAKGGQTLLCLDCGKELPHPDKDGIATCPDGHKWDLKRPTR